MRYMTLTHGQGAPRIETTRADEQPAGIPAPAPVLAWMIPPVVPAGARDASGRLAASDYTRELARRGGLAKAARKRQLRCLVGLGLGTARPEILNDQIDLADEFVQHEVERLGREDGAGVCPTSAALLVQQAGLAMAGSRAAYASGDCALGAKLGVEVRQMLLAARELTVRSAQSRANQPGGQSQTDRALAAILAGGQ
jgi:hypothetical protein